MPDLALCQNEDCAARERCYRYMAQPDPIAQTYGKFVAGIDGKCDDFLPLPKIVRRGRIAIIVDDEDDGPVFDRNLRGGAWEPPYKMLSKPLLTRKQRFNLKRRAAMSTATDGGGDVER